jgi:hypothetical protein
MDERAVPETISYMVRNKKQGSTKTINPRPGAQRRDGEGGCVKSLRGGRKLHARRWRHGTNWGKSLKTVGLLCDGTNIRPRSNKSSMADSRMVRWIVDDGFGNERMPIWCTQMEICLYIERDHRISRSHSHHTWLIRIPGLHRIANLSSYTQRNTPSR